MRQLRRREFKLPTEMYSPVTSNYVSKRRKKADVIVTGLVKGR